MRFSVFAIFTNCYYDKQDIPAVRAGSIPIGRMLMAGTFFKSVDDSKMDLEKLRKIIEPFTDAARKSFEKFIELLWDEFSPIFNVLLQSGHPLNHDNIDLYLFFNLTLYAILLFFTYRSFQIHCKEDDDYDLYMRSCRCCVVNIISFLIWWAMFRYGTYCEWFNIEYESDRGRLCRSRLLLSFLPYFYFYFDMIIVYFFRVLRSRWGRVK